MIKEVKKMKKYAFKITGSTLMILGFFLILGTAGADCDGDCMENSMPILDMVLYSLIGFASCFTGFSIVNYGSKYYE